MRGRGGRAARCGAARGCSRRGARAGHDDTVGAEAGKERLALQDLGGGRGESAARRIEGDADHDRVGQPRQEERHLARGIAIALLLHHARGERLLGRTVRLVGLGERLVHDVHEVFESLQLRLRLGEDRAVARPVARHLHVVPGIAPRGAEEHAAAPDAGVGSEAGVELRVTAGDDATHVAMVDGDRRRRRSGGRGGLGGGLRGQRRGGRAARGGHDLHEPAMDPAFGLRLDDPHLEPLARGAEHLELGPVGQRRHDTAARARSGAEVGVGGGDERGVGPHRPRHEKQTQNERHPAGLRHGGSPRRGFGAECSRDESAARQNHAG